jgi:hypothetical protein
MPRASAWSRDTGLASRPMTCPSWPASVSGWRFAAALERPLDAAAIVGAAARLCRADDRSSPDLIALRANVVTQVCAPTFEWAYSRAVLWIAKRDRRAGSRGG